MFRNLAEDRLTLLMKPRVKVVNPVLKIDGWNNERVSVRLKGALLKENEYKTQLAHETLVIWIDRNIDELTEMEISAG